MFKNILIDRLKLPILSLGFFCLFAVLACEPKDTGETIAIGEARNLPLGTEVTIMGRVTVSSGAFASSTPYGYALQNGKNGIYIMDSTTLAKEKYQMGQWVKVTGKLERTYGILMVREETSNKQMPRILHMPPNRVSTAGINEATAGQVVQTKGAIDSIVNDLPYGYKIYMNDGSGQLLTFVNTTTGLLRDTTRWRSADSVQVTGFSSQYEDLHELCPRILADIKILGDSRK